MFCLIFLVVVFDFFFFNKVAVFLCRESNRNLLRTNHWWWNIVIGVFVKEEQTEIRSVQVMLVHNRGKKKGKAGESRLGKMGVGSKFILLNTSDHFHFIVSGEKSAL